MDLEVQASNGVSQTCTNHCRIHFLIQSENTTVELSILMSSGGYEGYRPPFSNAPSSGYGQTQFNTSRDYSSSTYQRVSLCINRIHCIGFTLVFYKQA